MGYQRIVGLIVVLFLVIGSVVYVRGRVKGNNVRMLRVCTWSNYFPDSSINAFTEKTGIKVELSYISSNEELFSKLKAGATGFDIIQPSDYMVRQMNALNMLALLQAEALPNLRHLDDFYRDLPYDPGFKVSVPFTWGTTGIAINTEKVNVPPEGVGWKMLFESPDPKHTSLLDDMREVFSAVLMFQGRNPNTNDVEDLRKARKDISRIKDSILMFSSEPKSLLLQEELSIAHIYSTDAVQAHAENSKIKFFLPREGGVIWTDNFAIPKSSHHSAEAHMFINYFLEPGNVVPILKQNRLATPNRTARQMLSSEEQEDPNLYPTASILKKMFFLQDIGDSLSVINRMWTEIKS